MPALPTALKKTTGQGGAGFHGQTKYDAYQWLVTARAWMASASAQMDVVTTTWKTNTDSSVNALQASVTDLVTSVDTLQTDVTSINTWITSATKGINEKRVVVQGPASAASVAVTSLADGDTLNFVLGIKASTASIYDRTSDVSITSAGNLLAAKDLSAEGLVVMFRKA